MNHRIVKMLSWLDRNLAAVLGITAALTIGYVASECRIEVYALNAGAATYKDNTITFHSDRTAEVKKLRQQLLDNVYATTKAYCVIQTIIEHAESTNAALLHLPMDLSTQAGLDGARGYADLSEQIEAAKKVIGMPFKSVLYPFAFDPVDDKGNYMAVFIPSLQPTSPTPNPNEQVLTVPAKVGGAPKESK